MIRLLKSDMLKILEWAMGIQYTVIVILSY